MVEGEEMKLSKHDDRQWRSPHKTDHPDIWYYEEDSGITLYGAKQYGNLMGQTIPWRSLRAALRRYDTRRRK